MALLFSYTVLATATGESRVHTILWLLSAYGDAKADFEGETVMTPETTQELLRLNQQLLDSITKADWKVYLELCDPSLTCFEPEARGHLVEGLDFHQFYFKLEGVQSVFNTTMASPHVRVMGDAAVVSYVRLNQRQTAEGGPITTAVEETRVWQKKDGRWKHVHFHRSHPAG